VCGWHAGVGSDVVFSAVARRCCSSVENPAFKCLGDFKHVGRFDLTRPSEALACREGSRCLEARKATNLSRVGLRPAGTAAALLNSVVLV
jgi:hypothetical protein